ncbi:hypothetical protein OGAPHI_003918 [Ogataea philodendri]|uniref:PQ loop repeat protein n=1 Tax=Ogataea philodendri TaxID=1378263 RepID=A0A9P8P5S8_9ASCO|nr:uncharacterized protein OGAPHI_003918 [Ogataea philodendri]KAH3665730.1 hypothetical protein OGAPHI_003918 [Ogataea philodendri]
MGNNTAANVLSTIGTVLWCIQLTPQIYFLWRRKDATGFPPVFMFLWVISGIPFGIYFITSDSYIPFQLQPQMFSVLCSIAWLQSMYYPPNNVPLKRVIFYGILYLSISLAMQLGFGIPLKHLYSNGVRWPTTVFGIIAAVFLALGLLPPYWELLHRNGRVVGINFLFLAMDSAGAIFSMAGTLVGTFDLLGMIQFAVVLALEIGLYTSQAIWYIRFRVIRKEDPDEHEKDVQEISDSASAENRPEHTLEHSQA